MDTVTSARRSAIMRRVRSKNTSSEMSVRRIVYGMGYRYRLHRKDLPGKPDLVFAGRKKILFVHGCFWHSHNACNRARIPTANRDYWANKIQRNVERDASQHAALSAAGWQILIVWECELRDATALQARIREFLNG
ncbi:very short patch repair endonuclease [Paraburkholderia fungorum]|uniref:very short patch repair endonuclease n=1 Tax=Paraburkholderia fungorum TaxID=134537 RepID=UPI00248F111A|nr:DNA mismatch endonuclease Vsr [Paraburkholderia fungorum]